MVPRSRAQPISPSATWAGRIGVARIASYSLAYFSRKKMLNVESYMAPVIEGTASRHGATKSRHGMRCPTGQGSLPASPAWTVTTDGQYDNRYVAAELDNH